MKHEQSGDHFHLRKYPGCVQGSSMLFNSSTCLQAPSTIFCPELQNLVYNSNPLPTHSLLKSRSSTIGHLKYQLIPVFRQPNPLLGNTSPATVLSPHPQEQCRHTLCHDWTVLCISEHWLQFVLSAIFYELRMTFFTEQHCTSLTILQVAHLK